MERTANNGKSKMPVYASLFEPHSQDSYKTQSGSLYEFLLSVQLGLTSIEMIPTVANEKSLKLCTWAGFASAF